jgi:pyruvate,orthophosphate dikinase
MVYGNMNNNSGSGVAFTRNPSTGEKVFFGEYLPNVEGEDIVSGIRNPVNISEIKNELPTAYDELCRIERQLELHFTDMQDIEFTVENTKLFILQTRSGKRTALAAVTIAVAMVEEGLISERYRID